MKPGVRDDVSGMITTRFMQVADFMPFTEEWDDLYRQDKDATFFLSRKFLTPVLVQNAEDCVVLTAWRGLELVGFLPLNVRTSWDRSRSLYRTTFQMAGSIHWADYCGMLIETSVETEVIDAMAEALLDEPWSRVRFKNLRMSVERQERFFGQLATDTIQLRDETRMINDGETNNLMCPRINLPDDFDVYLAGLSRSTRQKLRRFLRKIDEGEYSVRQGGTDTDFRRFAELWATQWPKKARVDERAAHYADILRLAQGHGALSMPVLEYDGEIVCMLGSFLCPVTRTVWFFVSCRDLTFSGVPVGLMLHGHAIRQAISDGYLVYDLLRGDEPYKFQLGAEAEPIRYAVLRRRSAAPDDMRLSRFSARHLTEAAEESIASEKTDRLHSIVRQMGQLLRRSGVDA